MTDVEKRRTKIKVISVGEPKSFEGGGTVLHFKAQEEGVTNVLTFETWVTQLFDTVKGAVSQVIDVDVKEVPSKNGEYVNNRVGQVYVNGEPVNKRGGGGWRGDNDSPEKRASIEAQTAVKAILEYYIGIVQAGLPPTANVSEGGKLVEKALRWCERKLDAQIAPAPAPGPKADVKKAEKDSAELWGGLESEGKSGDDANIKSQVADFFQWVLQNKPELKNEKTARTWLLNVVKIKGDLIDTNPQACYKPVAELTGWSY